MAAARLNRFCQASMGGTSFFVAAVAGCIAVLVSLALFRVGPATLRNVFFLSTGAWRPYGRLSWLAAFVALVLIGVLVTPH